MSAQLFFSNSPAVLLDRLSDNLDWSDPFRSPRIATPTPAMKRWVQLRLAEKRGIVANVEFLQLERTLWERLGDLDLFRQAADRRPARILDENSLQLLILSQLRHRPPPQVADYLEAGDGEAHRARRLIQLAAKLAGYFREYEYSRVQEGDFDGLAYAWKHGEDCFRKYLRKDAPKSLRSQVEALERWQKQLYHDLFKEGGLRDLLGQRLGQYQYTLPQYAEMVLAQSLPAAVAGEPPAYHLFGLSQISPFHRSLIRRLADARALPGRHARFFIYSLNPCAEYWEDALDRSERRRVRQEDLLRRRKYVDWHALTSEEKVRLNRRMEDLQAEELHLEEENPLLGQWGRPGRETIQLWNEVPEYDFFSYYREPEGGGLLASVQTALLQRRGVLEPGERAPQDASLTILACPELNREVETARDCIIADLLADPGLRPDEIAILVPDMAKYRHAISAVFGRVSEDEPGHVPFSFGDGSASAESDYARAVSSLFAIARGRFSRKEILALAANPCFRLGRGLDEEAVKTWSDWAEALNIRHGFDAADRQSRGYPADDSHTWARGLDRLLLGTIMEAPPPGDVRHFEGLVPYADGRTTDRETLAPFLEGIGKLHRDLAPFRSSGPRTWGGWLEAFETLWADHLGTEAEDSLEDFVRADLLRFTQEVRRLDGVDALLGSEGGVSVETAIDLVLGHLEGLKAGRDGNFTGGVNIAGLHTLRSLPFRIIHVLGLGEGEFPEDPAVSTLDLRQYRRVAGDVDPAARNRYLFLETMVCASEKLRLSYVSRDVQQGKQLQMSSVLNELVDHLQQGILPPDAGGTGKFRITQIPLLARAAAAFPSPSPEPWSPPPNHDRQERLLGWIESEAKARIGEGGAVHAARTGLPAALRHEVFPAAPANLFAAPAAAPESGKAIPVLLDDLRRWIANPVESTLRKHLGIRDPWEDSGASDDEPFSCPTDCDRDLLERVVRERLARGPAAAAAECETAFNDLYGDYARRGKMPAGHFRVLDREDEWGKVSSALSALDRLWDDFARGGIPDLRLDVRMGEGDRYRAPGEGIRLPPVRLRTPAGRDVELHGSLPNLFRVPDGRGCATIIPMRSAKRVARFLSPFLFHLAALNGEGETAEWLRAGPYTLMGLHCPDDVFTTLRWAPFEFGKEKAAAYLGSLLDDYLAGPDFDLLPFDAIAKHLLENGYTWRLRADGDYAAILRDEIADSEGKEHAAWKATESVRILSPRVPDDAFAKIHSRLGPFFNA